MPRIDIPLRGFLVPDDGWKRESLTSDPSEGGPRPGSGTPGGASTLRVVGSGAQDADVDVKVVRSGYTGRGVGPAMMVKLTSDAEYLTWSPPWGQCFSSGVKSYDSATEDSPNATALQAQGIRLPGTTTYAIAHNGRYHRYDWDLDTWTDVLITDGDVYLRGCDITAIGDRLIYAAVYVTSDPRVDLWYSDDFGATWAEYATDVTSGVMPGSFAENMSIEYHEQTGTIALFIGKHLFASANMGLSFEQVSTLGFSEMKPAMFSDGTIIQPVSYNVGTSSANWGVVRTAGPYDAQENSNSGSPTYSLSDMEMVSLWVDEDDTAYALVSIGGYGSSAASGYTIYVSTDLGFNWTRPYQLVVAKLDVITGGLRTRFAPISCRGSQILPLTAVGTSDSSFEVLLSSVHLGEWAEVRPPHGTGVETAIADRQWLPAQVFDSTVTPGANSWEAGYYVLNTASSAPELWPSGGGTAFASTPSTGGSLYWDVECVSGGTSSTVGRLMQLKVTDGTNEYHIRCSISQDQIRVYDWKASAFVGTTAVLPVTNGRVQVWCMIDAVAGEVAVYYRSVESTQDRKWKKGPTGPLSSSVGTAHSYEIGHTGSTALTSNVYAMIAISNYLPKFSNDADIRSKRFGSNPYPVVSDQRGPSGISNDGLYLSVPTGLGLRDDTLVVPVEYDYGVRNLLALDSPSHARPWRSDNVTNPDRDIIISVGERRIIGRALAVLLRRSTVVSLTLAGRKGGTGSWTDMGTLDPSITYTYRTNGATLYPFAENAGLRYIRENELAGAWVDMAGTARKIAANTAGSLSNGPGRQCLITIADADGTEPANGTAIIHPHTSCMVIRSESIRDWDEWRVRINGQAVAPDAYWEIGALLVGSYQPVGLQPSHGWSHRKDPQVRQVRDSRGVAHRAQTGETQTVWSWSYQDPHDERQYLTYADDPPWIGGEGGPSDYLATYQDVSSLLWGVLDRMEGGALPCAVIAYDTSDLDGAVTISDPELFLYSYITTSIQRNNVLGAEGEDAVYRVESITAEEILG